MRKINGKSNYSGRIIQRIRESKNITREELAHKLQLQGMNVDIVYVYKIETQQRIIKDFELLILAKILNIDLNLINDEFHKCKFKKIINK